MMSIKEEKLALKVKVSPLDSEYDRFITKTLLKDGVVHPIFLMKALRVSFPVAKHLLMSYAALT